MPVIRSCNAYGCTHASPCPTHGQQARRQAYDDRRGSAHSRGYGKAWRQFTVWYRAEMVRLGIPPICGARLPGARETTDSDCSARGYVTHGRVVDHMDPIAGAHDHRLLDPMEVQLLCDGVTGRGCHDRKRQRERHG